MDGWDSYTFFVRAVFRIPATDTLEIYFLVREMGPFPSRVDFYGGTANAEPWATSLKKLKD